MQWDTATVSVVVSGIIATLGLIVTPLSNYFIDRGKWRRERRAVEIERINKAAQDLMQSLAHFQSGGTSHAANRRVEQVFSELLGRYYTWETVVWPYLLPLEREQAVEMRKTIEEEGGRSKTSPESVMIYEAQDVAKALLTLTHLSKTRIDQELY